MGLTAALLGLAMAACGGGGNTPTVTSAASSSLTVTLTGLASVPGDVTVTGPGNYSHHLAATGTLTNLADGTYTITASTVYDNTQPGLGRAGGGTLGPEHLARYPWQPVQTVTIAGADQSATVLYPLPTWTAQIPDASALPAVTTVPMDFVLVPAGSFTMGSDAAEDSAMLNAQPPHTVTFTTAFYMAKTELTQAQWKAVMITNPSSYIVGDLYPVQSTSWDSIKASFLPALNAALPGLGFRLPSEAEWEYTCRGGTSTAYFFGTDDTDLNSYAWWWKNCFGPGAVGTRLPNPWGLHDMAGNVMEWTEDDGHPGYTGAPLDGSAWVDVPRGSSRVFRDGSFATLSWDCRSAYRHSDAPSYFKEIVGFRVLLPVPRT